VIAVSNTSPLIALDSIGLLDPLPRLFERIQVPEAVAHELGAKASAAGASVSERDWLHVVRLRSSGSFDLLIRLVDLGEAEAIALSDQVGADILLIDDAAGRQVARQLNIPVAGVLGLLLRMKRKGLIERVSGYVAQLVDGNFYLSAQAVATVLAEAGEG